MVGVGYAYNSSALVSAYSSEKCYASPTVAFTESECCEFTGGPFSFLPATPRGAGFLRRDLLPIAPLYETSADPSQSLCIGHNVIGSTASPAVVISTDLAEAVVM